MHKAIAFIRKTMSEPPVAEQLSKYLRMNVCRVIGFQVVKEKPGAVEEYLLAVVEKEGAQRWGNR